MEFYAILLANKPNVPKFGFFETFSFFTLQLSSEMKRWTLKQFTDECNSEEQIVH